MSVQLTWAIGLALLAVTAARGQIRAAGRVAHALGETIDRVARHVRLRNTN
jgi:hypothetical protein